MGPGTRAWSLDPDPMPPWVLGPELGPWTQTRCHHGSWDQSLVPGPRSGATTDPGTRACKAEIPLAPVRKLRPTSDLGPTLKQCGTAGVPPEDRPVGKHPGQGGVW